MANLADTGAEWVSIVATGHQREHTSTRIRRTEATPSDAGIVHMIDVAHDLGLQVMLKPHVDLSHDPDHWRGDIGTTWQGQPESWDRWFRSYRAFIFHHAELAQANGVDQLSVGTELAGTVGRSKSWRRVIAGVRARFDGTLTYAATSAARSIGSRGGAGST